MQDKGRQTHKGTDLEHRLSAYYGPRLRAQPLTQDAWQQLRHKLEPSTRPQQRLSLKRFFNRYRARTRTFQSIPGYVYTAFDRIAYEAHLSYPAARLGCTFKKRLRAPVVHVSRFSRQHIRLVLPIDAERSLGLSALDILLASGLARYQLAKNVLLIYCLLIGFGGLGLAASIFYKVHDQPVISLLIVILGGLFLLGVLDRHKRYLCYAADELVIVWMGRSRMCEGLHALVRYTRAPQQRRWGEPSLHERINRVCGTRIESQSERLTMAR